jgi:hypothetical protein
LPHRWPTQRPALDAYGRLLASTYHAVAEVTGERVVVDTSKLPSAAVLVGLLPGIEPYFVHLVRDPRAVSHSWTRRRQRLGVDWEEQSVRHGPMHSTIRWLAYNRAAESLRKQGRRITTVRYEDFTRAPKSTIARILETLDEHPADLPFADEATVRLGGNHNLVGNPSRFSTGEIAIRNDDEWLRTPRRMNQIVTTALAMPSLGRYGYTVRPRAGENAP